jgi:signal transduction histidine kinase
VRGGFKKEMLSLPVPYEKLIFFKNKIGLDDHEFEKLEPVRHLFKAKKEEFAHYFYDFFLTISDTKMLLIHERKTGFLISTWMQWFEFVFTNKIDRHFFEYIWQIGTKHAKIHLDQRYSKLGFSLTRQFCHKIVESSLSADDARPICKSIDKIIDFCLLIETHAYIMGSFRCDREIINGIADELRNPVTVIGGNILRLKKKIESDSHINEVFDTIMYEIRRLEHMVLDIRTYIDILQSETHISPHSLGEIIEKALEKLNFRNNYNHVALDIMDNTQKASVLGDKKDLEYIFYYLLQNSLEAISPDNPLIRISSKTESASVYNIKIEIFNTGIPPRPENIEKLYAPFYSTKASGSGFGLPIARLAANKNYGTLELLPIEGEGTLIILALPVSL